MITIKDFDKQRLGNSLFELAFLLAQSSRHGIPWALPKWKYADYFAVGNKWIDDSGFVGMEIKEPSFDYCEELLAAPINNVSYRGYFQTEKYFNDQWDRISHLFRFRDEFLAGILDQSDFKPSAKDWAVHIRLTDYRNNPNYVNLSPSYYIEFFKKHPKDTFYIFTDDYGFCRKNFQHVPNVEFVDLCSDIEHLCLMSQFKNLMMANSSFSWWGAKLAELYNKRVRVIRPDGLFAGNLATKYSAKDFYPERWEVRALFNLPKPTTNTGRTNLKDVTFVIPVKYDHPDRKENLDICINFLQYWFDTNIIVGEQGGNKFSYVKDRGCRYMEFKDMYEFHRTKMINDMVRVCDTPYVFNWDADVIVSPLQIIQAVEALKNDAFFVYPYDGRFVRLPREAITILMSKDMDVSSLWGMGDKKWYERYNSVGGSVGFRVDKFWGCGGEPEQFISHSPEDVERVYRYKTIYGEDRVKRIDGVLFHIDHYKGNDSTHANEYTVLNKTALRLSTSKNKEQLLQYIKTWPWVK